MRFLTKDKKLSIIISAIFFHLALSASLFASTIVKDVKVEGNERIETGTIIAHSKIHVGEAVDQLDLDSAVRSLFDTGYFSDVKVDLYENDVIIKVQENPIVNRVTFEGNHEFDDATLEKQISLKPRQVYTTAKLKQDTKLIHDMYRIKGHFSAQVIPQIIRRDQNRVDIVFQIYEGGATKVSKIIFIGNNHFKSDVLQRMIMTKESRWYRFFSSDDTYDPDRLSLDQEMLRRFYLENGYVDFRVKSAVAELTPDHTEFFITFTIEEGERYKFGKVDVNLKIPKIQKSQIEKLFTFHSGQWYSSRDIDGTIKAITAYLGEHGYAFVDVQPKLEQDSKNHLIHLTMDVLEGPKVYVNRIVIEGNIRTNEDVIRREILLFEGDAYNTYKLKRSEQRIKNLGFFKRVAIKETPTEVPDRIDLIVTVEEEESTGELWVAGGYSSSEGIIGNIGIKENNLMGRGVSARLQGSLSKKRNSIDLSYTEPYFLGYNLSAGFDVFRLSSKKYFGSAFEHDKTGFALRAGYDLTDFLSQGWSYSLHFDDVRDLHSNVSQFIKQQAGKTTTSSLQHRLFYDRRDNRFDPTEGYYLGTTNEVAGLGGNVGYYKNEVFAGYYYPVVDQWIISLSASGGVMNGAFGKDVRIADRFSVGGDGSLRGFRESGAEVRDRNTLDPLGALKYYLGTVELQVPLEPFGVPNEFGLKGHLFSDIGAGWGAEEPKSAIYSSSSPRVSVGVGISWRSPLGPLRIDFATDVRSESFDKHKTIHFGFFTRF